MTTTPTEARVAELQSRDPVATAAVAHDAANPLTCDCPDCRQIDAEAAPVVRAWLRDDQEDWRWTR